MSLASYHEKEVKSSLAPIYFMYMGGGSLLSWNAILNSLDYFTDKFPGRNVSFMFPLGFYLAQFLSSLIVTKLSAIIMLNVRVIGSFLVASLILALLPIEAAMFKDTGFGFALVMIFLFVLGICANICLSSITGLSSQLPGKYSAYTFLGTSITALFLSILREASSFLFKGKSKDENTSVVVFFGITAVYIIGCIIFQLLFTKTEFFITYLRQPEKMNMIDSELEVSLTQTEMEEQKPAYPRNVKTFINISYEVRFYVVLYIITAVQLYAIFPGVILKKPMPGVDEEIKVVSIVMTFNVFQTIGKVLGKYRKYYTPSSVFGMVMFRFVLMGLIIAQAATTDIPIIDTVWFGYLTTAVFGLTLGFVIVALTVLAPERVDTEKKEIVGHVSIFAINAGVLCGTFTALPFAYFLK